MNFTFSAKNESAAVTLTPRTPADGITILDVDIDFGTRCVPQPVTVTWRVPCADVYSVYCPGHAHNREIGVSWSPRVSDARLASGAPVQQLISLGGRNRLTVALSDAATPTAITTGIDEHTAEFVCTVKFFTEPINELERYHASVRIDTTDIPYEAAMRGVHAFWRDAGYAPAPVPDAAEWPVYSTWYSFHQAVDVDAIVAQCRMAKAMGMDTIIVDDGWQIAWGKRGYITCGDWEPIPEKVADMREFVDRVHAEGMKFVLWYSVPFVGKESKIFSHFEAERMFLGPVNHLGAACLDPRFPAVRAYLTDIYTRAAREWGLDGFKLDFIDSFKLGPQTPAFDERWDTRSLEQGVDWLLRDVTEALLSINPDMMIEFRQSYYGPNICHYGNMIRVSDCPNSGLANHTRGTNLRLALGGSAPHSDMLMWHNDDPVESVAMQLIDTLFYVPQISVKLDEIPESHRKALAHFLRFWRTNRDTLLHGSFSAENPEALYTVVKAERDGHLIAALHTKPVLSVERVERLSMFNATADGWLYLRTAAPSGEKTLRVYACTGELIEERQFTLEAGTYLFDVPCAGLVEIG